MTEKNESQPQLSSSTVESTLKTFLDLNGVSFLPSQWQLALQTHEKTQTTELLYKTVLQYLEFASCHFKNYSDIKSHEQKLLGEGALCFLTNGDLVIKHNQNANLSSTVKHAIELVEKPEGNNRSLKQLGLLEFWRLLRHTDWLTDSIQKGFSNFKSILIASVLINLLALSTAIFSIQVYDRIIPNQAFASLAVLVTGVLLCLFFELLIKNARHSMMEHAATVTDTLCTKKLAQTLLNASTPTTNPTQLMQHLRAFETVREVITGMFLLSLVDLPFMFLFLFVLTLIHPYFLLVAIAILLITALNTFRLHHQLSKLGAKQINQQRNNQSHWIETLTLLPLLQTLGVQNIWSKQLIKQQVDLRITGNHVRAKITASTQFTYLIQQLGWISIIAVGAWLTINNELTIGGMIAASMMAMRSFSPIQKLQSQLIQTHIAQAGFIELNQFMQQQTQQENGLTPLSTISHIALNDISVSLPNSKTLISEINLTLKAGDRVGLIGPNGSGKTTLLKCLSGIFKPTQGGYCINHLDQSQISHSEIAKQIGYAEQPPLMIANTLLENIRFNRPWGTSKDCLDAAEQLGLIEWINQLPKGIHTRIDQGGTNLSSGLKQMISIARAMAGKPKLLLLDEPTVCLDERSENHFIQALSKFDPNSIVVFSTHRTHLLRQATRLVLLTNGKIKAQGDHHEVLLKAKDTSRAP